MRIWWRDKCLSWFSSWTLLFFLGSFFLLFKLLLQNHIDFVMLLNYNLKIIKERWKRLTVGEGKESSSRVRCLPWEGCIFLLQLLFSRPHSTLNVNFHLNPSSCSLFVNPNRFLKAFPRKKAFVFLKEEGTRIGRPWFSSFLSTMWA